MFFASILCIAAGLFTPCQQEEYWKKGLLFLAGLSLLIIGFLAYHIITKMREV